MKPETQRTFKVAILLCLGCSVVVSSLAVGLDGIKKRKKEAFRQQSILEAAGLWEDGADPAALYQDLITPVVVDLQTKSVTERYQPTDRAIDLQAMMRNPEMYDVLDQAVDLAGIKKREAYSVVYEVRENDVLKTVVLPIRGRGLWSTLYGYLALDMTKMVGTDQPPSATELSVLGLIYYKHGETPGLGGEVESRKFKEAWPQKKIYDQNWNVKVDVVKMRSPDEEEYQVDALSGATITSNGVSSMLKFWLGAEGFLPYLQTLSGVTDAGQKIEPQPSHDTQTDAAE